MLGLVWRRLVQLVPVAFGITAVTFFLLRVIPGNPAQAILGYRATPEAVARLNAALGLDRSILTQYALFLGRLARADLGDSYVFGEPVLRLVVDQLAPTLLLVSFATVLSTLVAVPLAIAAALGRGSMLDHAIRLGLVVGIGLPSYWLGLVLILAFAIAVPLLPVGGYGEGTWMHLRHLSLPALTLAAGIIPVILRSLRSSLIEALQAHHVATARAKGLGGSAVLVRHVLRNALIPAVTLLGVNVGWLVGGTVVVESVFGVPGLGMLLFRAIGLRDYPTIQAVTLTLAVLTVLIQLATDVGHMLLDPRARGSAA